MKFRVISAFIAIATVAGLVLSAAPAYAFSGPGHAGSNCYSQSCDVYGLILPTPPVVSVSGPQPPPPPCQVTPVGDARSGSKTIIAFYQGSDTVAQPTIEASASGSPSASPASPSAAPTSSALDQQDEQILSQAQTLASENPMPVGEWYQVVPTTPADQAQCDKYQLFIWQPGTGNSALRKIGLYVSPGTLAQLLTAELNLAKIGSVVLSPRADSDTNLPTFVQVTLTPVQNTQLFLTAKGDPYVMASVQTDAGATATVWAWVTGLTIQPGATDAKTFDTSSQCTQAHPGPDDAIMLGSRYSTQQMAAAGAGATIDCGVTYGVPGSYELSVSVNWKACWVPALPTPGGPPPPSVCKNVPGGANLQPSNSGNIPVNVRSISAIN